MPTEKCGSEDPTAPGLLCDKTAHPFGHHMNLSSKTIWAGLAPPVRKKGPKGGRIQEVIDSINESGNGIKVGPPRVGAGPPKAAVDHWERTAAQWLAEAKEALHQVCLSEQTFTGRSVWARLVDTKERRAMVQVVKHGLRCGWMVEDSAMRETEVWTTLDGHEFPLNKLVPIYRSLLISQ